MNKTYLVILCGKSSTGKSYVLNQLYALLKQTKMPVNKVVSCTTRPKRDGERDNIDYFFLDRDKFLADAASGYFLEYAEFRGWYYGTLESTIWHNAVNIMVLNPDGVKHVMDYAAKHWDSSYGILLYWIDTPFFTRLRRSIGREGKFKWEYLRRAFTDFGDFLDDDFRKWFDCYSSKRWYDIEYYHGCPRFNANQIKGLPEETLCDRIVLDLGDKMREMM